MEVPKRKVAFQKSIFRGYVSFSEGILFFWNAGNYRYPSPRSGGAQQDMKNAPNFRRATHATADYFVVMDNFSPVTVEWRKLYSIMGIPFAKRVVYGLCFVLETTWNTLPATNIAPENQWFEDEFPSAMAYFQRPCQFQRVYHYKSSYDTISHNMTQESCMFLEKSWLDSGSGCEVLLYQMQCPTVPFPGKIVFLGMMPQISI